jgi:hypothetical protein
VPDQLFLLFRRELDHPVQVIRMNRGKDAAVDAKIGMTHVLAFKRIRHSQCDASKPFASHGFPLALFFFSRYALFRASLCRNSCSFGVFVECPPEALIVQTVSRKRPDPAAATCRGRR